MRVQVAPDQAGALTLGGGGRARILTLPDLVLRAELPLDDPAPIQAEGEGFRIRGQFYPSPIRLVPPEGGALSLRAAAGALGGAGRSYRGVLDLLNLGGRIRAINEVSLEEYLAGVVGMEMPAAFPQAALEAQAVAARTYALYHLRNFLNRPLSEAFDAGPDFQVYAGVGGENASALRAVRATAGWVLTHQGKLFPAYYHSTCGGSTTSASWAFGLEDIPALQGVPCDGCVGSPTYRWRLSLSLKQLEAMLRPWAEVRKITLGDLERLEGLDPLPGGYLRYVRVVHSRGSFELRADRFRSLLTRNGLFGLRSTSFEVKPGAEAGTVEFRGAGWGHGVGLCQYGAARRGREGSYLEVLAFYYPGSELKKVY